MRRRQLVRVRRYADADWRGYDEVVRLVVCRKAL
jgi:hypothetical protein